MKRYILAAGLLVTVGLAACDKPTVVNVPAPVVVTPAPAGPAGPPGAPGAPGEPGKSGDTTTVIVQPVTPAEPTK